MVENTNKQELKNNDSLRFTRAKLKHHTIQDNQNNGEKLYLTDEEDIDKVLVLLNDLYYENRLLKKDLINERLTVITQKHMKELLYSHMLRLLDYDMVAKSNRYFGFRETLEDLVSEVEDLFECSYEELTERDKYCADCYYMVYQDEDNEEMDCNNSRALPEIYGVPEIISSEPHFCPYWEDKDDDD